ncbi:MAG: hypothetical protein AAB855_00545 [Patescibacteria group bacterium]
MNDDLLHVVSPRACNTQQTTLNHATCHATGAQQTNLKALADAVLARNKRCNNRATAEAKGTQQPLQQTSSFVASTVAEHFEERAAIQEYDAGLPRKRAEQAAMAALRVYEYRLTGNPSWLVYLAPGVELSEAERCLRERFRENFITVRQRPMSAGR